MGVVEGRMEQALEYRLGDSMRRHAGVLPCFDHEIDCIFHNSPGDLSCRLVEDERKVVFRQERVSGVGCVEIVPDFFLVVVVYNGLGSLTERSDGGSDQRLDEWLEGGNDKHRDVV